MKTLLSALLAILFLGNGFVMVFSISCRQLPSNPDACCKIPKHEREAEVVDECVKTYLDQTMRERADKMALERGCCIAECIMNGTGHTDISEAKMVELDLKEAEMMGMLDEWKDTIAMVGKKCADEGAKQADRFEEGFKLAPVDAKDMVCHPKNVFALMCTAKEYVLNCPSKFYTESKECTELKEFLNTCEM